ncbi:alpha-aminoadipyl-cysteinyl-valine synthetase [Xylariales sp. PMI_506]|nr:alpha-aminoadipyl-cysteinyl-valine synthetase [Xylariales sp. PMI_506]
MQTLLSFITINRKFSYLQETNLSEIMEYAHSSNGNGLVKAQATKPHNGHSLNGTNINHGDHSHNDIVTHNGTTASVTCWLCTIELSKWKKTMQNVTERCDLSGLSSEPTKYQLASTGMCSHILELEQRTVTIPDKVREVVVATCSERRLRPESVVLLAVHQMLKGFGNGSYTSTASFLPREDQLSWVVIPTVVDHCRRRDQLMASALEDARSHLTRASSRSQSAVAPDDLVREGLLDIIVVFDSVSEVRPPLPAFPLILWVNLQQGDWKLTLQNASRLFSTMVIDSLLGAMQTLLAATADPACRVEHIELLPAKQLAQLNLWNYTDGDYPREMRLHHLFESIASQGGDRVALLCGEREVTYRELNEQANRLAHFILSIGVVVEQLIGLFLDKNEKMITTILGVWKSGAAYTPIDPAYPDERVRFILDDTRVQIVLASQKHVDRLENEILGSKKIRVIALEPLLEVLDQQSSSYPVENLSHLPLTSKQLAYLTYTSGTTGFPKGIYKEHTSVVNSITDLSVRYGVAGNEDEVILLFSAYVFEPFARQMLMALTTGNRLAIISDEDKFDPETLLPFIRRHKVTYLNGTASVLQEYDLTSCPSLKRMILVGENLTDARYGALRRRFKARIFNEYGFTESAFVTALKIFEPASDRTDMSLGRPVRNVKCYILDANLRRVPLGVTGELHIGGLGISRGYMNRDDLTRTKFLRNPYQTDSERERGVNGLMYKTGDLARWLPNGEVEYLGRVDFQIKLRGIRIEPGEIESTLVTYPGVRTSIVVSKKLLRQGKETKEDLLVGYFVCDEATLCENDLLVFLEHKLPRYMIPARLVQLKQIPVTINGKADLRALPTVEVAVPAATTVPSRQDEIADRLAKIWGDVLQIPSNAIGHDQSFFRLGGHSITCIQLIARVRQHLGKAISLEQVFRTKTLGAMADLLRLQQPSCSDKVANGVESGPQLPKDRSENKACLANSLQQGFVYHSLKTQQSEAYIMQSTLHYQLPLAVDKYNEAWASVQMRHPALRLRFAWENEVMQMVEEAPVLHWRVDDWSNVDEEERENLTQKLLQSDRSEGFRLGEGSLMRLYYVHLAHGEALCVFSCHHSILDGWSLPILFEQVHETYLRLVDEMPPSTETDQSYMQSQLYLQEHREEHLSFWSEQLARVEERCDMSSLLNESSRYKVPLADYDWIKEQRQQTVLLPWNDSTMANLQAECLNQGLTIHSVLQLVWHLVLHAYGGGTTITGTTISGRHLPITGIERSIGMFINTLPLVFDHESCRSMTALEAMSHVQDQVNAMNSHGNVELGRLRKDDLKHGLFDSLFVLENYPSLDTSQRVAHEKRLRCRIEGGTETLSYPLAVIAREHGVEGCSFSLCYAGELFTDETIEALLHTVRDTFAQVTQNVHAPLSDLEYLSQGQKQQLNEWNSNEAEFPNATLHAMFESEAHQHPDKVAVVYEDVRLTYRELNSRANALANHLLSMLPIQPNKIIGLVLEKSEHMITSILAVWKTGGAYVPIDPKYPDHRIKYLLEDTHSLAVITDAAFLGRIESITEGLLPVIPSDEALRLPPNPVHPVSTCYASDLAYIMYTSGTTGLPKGVMVEHHGVVNLAVSLGHIFGLRDTDDEVILSFSNYVFDHFVEQMTDALLNGQTLVVLNDEMRGDKERLYRYISENKVTYISGTPSVISMYEFDRFRSHMRRIDCVGEAFSEPVFDKIRETFPGLVINGYGPTEVSITTSKRLYPFPERRTNKSIGSQVANSTSYVLNADMKRVPIGAVGELFLGGDGVARGYHNRPELTAERFPPNPFQTEEEKRRGQNGRLYKTGDLVRWIPGSAGEVEYLGRNDFQVKIRGQRIELGEIEAILSSYDGIDQSVVLAKDGEADCQKYLVGYYVAASSANLNAQAIRSYMKTRLPNYMVPSRLIPVETFPVTVSGKLDTKALPLPAETDVEDAVPPRTKVERALASIWAEVLDVPLGRIGIYSDFFGLGGDSLKSTRLSFAASKALGVAVSVGSLFNHPTIESLSRWIEAGTGGLEDVETYHISSHAGLPLSPAQERLLFLHKLDQDGGAYNISWHMKLSRDVCYEALAKALGDVIERHEALRTLIKLNDDTSGYSQVIMDAAAARNIFRMQVVQISSENELRNKMMEADKYSFDLESALPLFICVYKLSNKEQEANYTSLVFHHMAFDAWSWNIFRTDLGKFYSAHLNKKSQGDMSPLQMQYKEYALEHRKSLESSHRKTLDHYWLKKLADLESLHLITDHPRPAQFDYAGSDLRFSLEQQLGTRLRSLAKEQGSSLYTVVASAFVLLLSVYTSQHDVVIGVPVSHRTRAEFESVVGFFVNLLPLRVSTSQPDIRGLIQTVREELVKAQSHQDLPFQNIAKLLHTEHDLSRHPLVQVVFNWETAANKTRTSILGDEYQPHDALPSVAKFDLNVTVTDDAASLNINFNYATSLFKHETIRGFMSTFHHILEQFANKTPSTSLSSLSFSDKSQSPSRSVSRHERKSASIPKSLSEIFENQVSTFPESIAVVDGNRRISYEDINIRANKLARYIKSYVQIEHGECVALILDKSIDTIVSILAVWKLGAAYVPLDPGYPSQRIKFILEATEAKLVVTTSKHCSVLSQETGAKMIALDAPRLATELQKQPKENLAQSSPGPSSPAYVIFTSGTTGKPKGVLIEHQSVANLRDALVERYFSSSQTQQAILFLSSYVFDFSVEQFCLSVLSGNKLVIPPEEGLTHEAFYALANNERLTYISGTPSVLQQIQLSRLAHLKMVTAAGEEFRQSQYESMRLKFKGLINNAYGITETTVYNIVTQFGDGAPFTKLLKEALPGTHTYVLDDNLQPVPENAVGELYIGGECLSHGYLGQDELTKERFIADPFITTGSEEQPQRLYKTGDMVQYLGRDGIKFIGRRDLQVKLRGFRIELSEIRDAALAVPGVKEAIVVPRHANGKSISGSISAVVCFYTVLNGSDCAPDTLRTGLSITLPQFMVPSQIHRLEGSLPVTINGKVDVTRLSELIDRAGNQAGVPFSQPRNLLETQLCELWASLLNIDRCGIDDDLFAHGGDSISSLQLVGDIYRKLERKVTVKDIFVHRTVRALCENVMTDTVVNGTRTEIKADQGLVEGTAPLLPIQEWFLSKQLKTPSFWNHCFTIRTPDLAVDRLEWALQRLHERHDVLRLRLTEVDGTFVQDFSQNSAAVGIQALDIRNFETAEEMEEKLAKFQSNFDINNGPIYTAVYIHGYQDGSARIWFAVHHLVVDTVSWSILTSDLQSIYRGNDLGLKSSSVRQWSLAVKEHVISSSERAYWERIRERVLQNAQVNLLHTGGVFKAEETLSAAKTASLYRKSCARLGMGVHEILLTAVAAAMQKFTEGAPTVITVEGHGREDCVDPMLDISRTVGWFTSMYPLELPKVDNLVQGTLDVKEAVAHVPNNGVSYGPIYGYDQSSLPAVSVNYLGRLDQIHQSPEGWTLDVGEYELPLGLCTSAEDACSSSSMVDITFFTLQGQLITQLSCAWGHGAAHTIMHTIQRTLKELIDTTGDNSFTLPSPMANGDVPYEPFFQFKDGARRGPPLFMLPPGEGGAESYFHNIVSGLPDRDLVVFNNYYRHSKGLKTIEELADYYLSLIKSIQPEGPYDLLGWSFGGILALEMAQRLTSRGERIRTLSLIDPYFDVPAAARAIGHGQDSVLDPIYDKYQPCPGVFEGVERGTDRIILFKASKTNDERGTSVQRKLYDWYAASAMNNLDTYIPPKAVQVVPLEGTHFTWVRHSKQVRSICKLLRLQE